MTGTFSTATLDSTEYLAIMITREHYAQGRIDHDELDRRLASIIGLNGHEERKRVLFTEDVVDITVFGSPAPIVLASGWQWPDEREEA